MSSTGSLPEIPFDSAEGNTRLIYDAIAQALGVRLVNLVYRHLATRPGCLEWAWGVVGPAFQNGQFANRGAELADLVKNELIVETPTYPLASLGLGRNEVAAVMNTLDAYIRANPMNALSLEVLSRALREDRPVAKSLPRASTSVDLRELLPMSSVDTLPASTRGLLGRITVQTVGEGAPMVPSLFRHFVQWPSLLSAMTEILEAVPSPEAMADRIRRQASVIAGEISDVLATDGTVRVNESEREGLVSTIEIFSPAICRMIVLGGMLRQGLKP